jgi:pilus assembly protein CpaE
MQTLTQELETSSRNVLSVALIGPEGNGRRTLSTAFAGTHQANSVKEFFSYPHVQDAAQLFANDYDVIVVDLDSNPEYALQIIEAICETSTATVMVYSSRTDSDLLVRCMRAGAREFLSYPIAPNTISEALLRTAVRHPSGQPKKKVGGKLLVFLGAKGGAGVTTIASNFAVALAQESGHSTALIDLDLPLGDTALHFGITGQFSTANALQNFTRLDSNFLSKLFIKHGSGVSVLAASDRYAPFHASEEAVEKLLSVARQDFEYVVVDGGSGVGSSCRSLMDEAAMVYLVTQIGVSELRNSNRFISEFFSSGSPKLEVVLNRFAPRAMGIDEDTVTKALTRPAEWKISSDYQAVRRAQNTARPLVLEDSQISRVIRQMARKACGKPAQPDKKKWTIFG